VEVSFMSYNRYNRPVM